MGREMQELVWASVEGGMYPLPCVVQKLSFTGLEEMNFVQTNNKKFIIHYKQNLFMLIIR